MAFHAKILCVDVVDDLLLCVCNHSLYFCKSLAKKLLTEIDTLNSHVLALACKNLTSALSRKMQ